VIEVWRIATTTPSGGRSRQSRGTRDFYHFYLVPGHTTEHVKTLADELRQAVEKAPAAPRLTGDGLVPAVAAGSRATVCPRHVLVHPAGRRDPRLHPTGYSFHTFVPRKRTAEPFRSVELRRSRIAAAPLVLYAPDLDRPFDNELGGVTVDRHFHFEVLDRHQQYLSLIGAAHLILHAPDQPGCAVANFHADGRLRSLEVRVGRVGFADEVQVFADQIIVKIGKSSKAVWRRGRVRR
jgi:hypothetical protein